MNEIHDDPALTAAYLKGLAAGRSEARPVPDEQAIERAVDAARLTFNDETLSLATLWPAIARAVLTAALEQPE